MVHVISWNVNSIKARISQLQHLCTKYNPDILLLQELKCVNQQFPTADIEDLGYNVVTHGQKTYNGVAILSKYPVYDVIYNLPNYQDEQARYIECYITIDDKVIRVASVYVPNGADPESDKFIYKLEFLKALQLHFNNVLQYEEVFLAGGDYNIAPNEIDVYDPKGLQDSVCYHIEERKIMHQMLSNNLFDSYRLCNPQHQEYSWWDYRGGGFRYNRGMRIDHILISPEAVDTIDTAGIYKEVRGLEKPSDHAPIYCKLKKDLL